MFCQNCGSQIPDNSAFCPNCGAQLGAARQSQTSQYEQYERQEKPGKTKKIILIVVAVIAIYGILQVVNSIVNKDEPPVDYRPNQIIDAPSNSGGTSELPPYGSYTGSPWDVPAQTGGTTNANTNTNTTPTQNTESTKTAADWSTDALPREADFDWFYDRATGKVNANVPSGATAITDPSLLAGGWKVFILRTPTTKPYRQYWNMDMTVNGTDVEAVQYWSGVIEDGEFKDWSGDSPNSFAGTFDRSGSDLMLKDLFGCDLTIYDWFEYNGAQYGVGTYYCVFPSDVDDPLGMVAFCRP